MSKRRIVVFDRVSADGYFAGSDGNLNWTVPDDALDRAGVEGMSQVDAMLFGRRTYDMFESFWPNVVKEGATASDPHASGSGQSLVRGLGKSTQLRLEATKTYDSGNVMLTYTRKK